MHTQQEIMSRAVNGGLGVFIGTVDAFRGDLSGKCAVTRTAIKRDDEDEGERSSRPLIRSFSSCMMQPKLYGLLLWLFC